MRARTAFEWPGLVPGVTDLPDSQQRLSIGERAFRPGNRMTEVGRKENGSSGTNRPKKLPFVPPLPQTAPDPSRTVGCPNGRFQKPTFRTPPDS